MLIASTIHESLILCSGHYLRKLAGQTPCLPLGLSQSSQMGTGQVPRMSGRQTAKLLITRNRRPHRRGQLFSPLASWRCIGIHTQQLSHRSAFRRNQKSAFFRESSWFLNVSNKSIFLNTMHAKYNRCVGPRFLTIMEHIMHCVCVMAKCAQGATLPGIKAGGGQLVVSVY